MVMLTILESVLPIEKKLDRIFSSSATEQLLMEVQDKANGQDILDLNDISGGVVTSIIGQLGLDNGIEMVREFLIG
jgi:hypothetical protein